MSDLFLEQVGDLSGGRNSNDSQLLLPSSQSPDDLNLVGKTFGAVTRRQGTNRLFGSAVSERPVMGITMFQRSDGQRWVVFATDDALWAHNLDTQITTQIDHGFMPCQPWTFASLNDWLYCTNMADIPFRWDGTNIRQVGLPKAVFTGTLEAIPDTGFLSTGTYYYRIAANYGVLGVSNLSDDAISVVVVNDDSGFVTFTGEFPVDSVSIHVFRTLVNPPANPSERVYYFVGEITSTYGVLQDTLSDNDVGDQYLGDRQLPPCAAFVTHHGNRLWWGNLVERVGNSASNSDVAYSELYHGDILGDSGNETGRIAVFPGDGDVVTGIAPLRGNLSVFKGHQIYQILGTSILDFDVRDTHSDVGCIAPRSIAKVNNKLYFLSDKGVHFFDGQGVRRVSDRIDADLRTISGNNKLWASGWEFRNRYYLSVKNG